MRPVPCCAASEALECVTLSLEDELEALRQASAAAWRQRLSAAGWLRAADKVRGTVTWLAPTPPGDDWIVEAHPESSWDPVFPAEALTCLVRVENRHAALILGELLVATRHLKSKRKAAL